MAACKVEYEADLPLPARGRLLGPYFDWTYHYICHPSTSMPFSERSAFNFENVTRNIRLETDSGVQVPKARKTGTTICGVVFKV